MMRSAIALQGLTVPAAWLLTDPECGDVPLLTPGSKEMMSQALKATFSGFTKEQLRLGIPKGKPYPSCCSYATLFFFFFFVR